VPYERCSFAALLHLHQYVIYRRSTGEWIQLRCLIATHDIDRARRKSERGMDWHALSVSGAEVREAWLMR